MSEAITGKTWKQLPCQKCGEQVTTHPGGRAAHTRNCKGKVEDNAPKVVVEIDPYEGQADGPKLRQATAANPTLADEIKYAEAKTGQAVEAIQRVRASAPDAIVSFTASPDQFKAEEQRLRAEGKVPDDHVFYWGDIREHKANVHKYIPVNDDGKQTQVGENEAFHRHKDLYKAEIASSEAQSKAMFDSEYDIGGESRKPLYGDTVKPNQETGKLLK